MYSSITLTQIIHPVPFQSPVAVIRLEVLYVFIGGDKREPARDIKQSQKLILKIIGSIDREKEGAPIR